MHGIRDWKLKHNENYVNLEIVFASVNKEMERISLIYKRLK